MLQAVTVKNCRVCQKQFSPFQSMQVVCSVKCAAKVPVIAKKQRTADHQARIDKLKGRSYYINQAQAAVNKYVRLRDAYAGHDCITCDSKPREFFGGHLMDCGHYLSRGNSPHLRFHLHNMAAQCVKDNRYLGGLGGKFRTNLIERIGLEKVEALESSQGPAKFTIDYLQRLKQVFRKKARRLEKRMEQS